MAITPDIIATYRGPGRVVARLLAMGQREDRAIMFLMIACVLIFVGRWPAAARTAYLDQGDMGELITGNIYALLFGLPLIAYLIAGLSHLVARAFGGQGDWYGARISFFWALLATAPLALLSGLVEGYVGPGPGLKAIEAIYLIVLLWFWLAGLRQSEWGRN